MRKYILLLAVLLVGCEGDGSRDVARQPDEPQTPTVQRYLAALDEQRAKMKGVRMDVRMVGSIPKLTKTGSMRALRAISSAGKVTYDALNFDGDTTVKKEVIARYMAAEAENMDNPNPSLAISPRNYKFKEKGIQQRGEREVVVLELNPRRKEVGLFRGEIWLDPATMLPVREAGQFVKSPSVFIKKVQFIRDYEIKDGISVPTRMTSFADTRIVGRTELNISFSNFAKASPPPASEEASECQSLPE